MMRSLFSGVSGIKVHQTRMDVIGNNIANINTIGFKSSRTTFSDMLSQFQSSAAAPTEGRGGVNAKQIGLGANVESIDIIFTDSSSQQTGKNTDLALSGNGLFVLRDDNKSYYTRNGAFSFDESGYYVMPGNGLRVQGWNAESDGTINTNGTATDVIVPVGKTMEATATSAIDYTGNLNKESLIIDKITYVHATGVTDEQVFERVATGTVDETTSINVDGENVISATLTMKDGSIMHVTSGYYEVGRSIPITTLATVYDSLGGRHEITVLIDKDPTTADPDANNDALETSKATGRFYTDDNGIEHSVTENTDTIYTYNDADGNPVYVTADKTVITAGTVTADPTITVTRQDDGSYLGSDGNTYTVSQITGTAWALASDTTQAVTEAPAADVAYKYTDGNGEVQYLKESDTTTRPVYDNRWRVYLAPTAGQKGPGAGDEFNNAVTYTEADGSTVTATMNAVIDTSGAVTSTSVSYLYFDERGQFVTNGRSREAEITFSYGNGNGAASNTGVVSFTGMTQYANSTTASPATNGNTAGVLQSVAIDGSGIINGTYTNGLVRQEAQIAVAQFNNSSGLTKVGTTIYTESNNSGLANVKTIDDFGLSVTSSALEMSNVDLATEFSDMIITQRGFQANSKITTVSDELLETLINLKR